MLFFANWILLQGSALSSHAQTTVQIRTNYYEVNGTTAREVRRALNRPHVRSGRVARHAETRWDLRWNFSLRPGPAGCQLHSFETTTIIAFTMPRLAASAEISDELQSEWDRYLAALALHEDGHKRLALAAAAEVQKRVRALSAGGDCESFKRRLEQTIKAAINEFRDREKEYDEKTNHGATQGARFFR